MRGTSKSVVALVNQAMLLSFVPSFCSLPHRRSGRRQIAHGVKARWQPRSLRESHPQAGKASRLSGGARSVLRCCRLRRQCRITAQEPDNSVSCLGRRRFETNVGLLELVIGRGGATAVTSPTFLIADTGFVRRISGGYREPQWIVSMSFLRLGAHRSCPYYWRYSGRFCVRIPAGHHDTHDTPRLKNTSARPRWLASRFLLHWRNRSHCLC